MGIVKKSLDFHQTFKPERNCLSSILTELTECSGKTVQDISKITGVPTGESSGKVAPSISYLSLMGLISDSLANKKYELSYTELGQCVVEEDPGFMEELTLLLLHCMITRKNSGADLWHYIICDLLPKHGGTISKNHLDKEIEMKYKKDVKMGPLSGSYTGLFAQLDILSISSDTWKMNSHQYNDDFIYLYAYVLYSYWDEWMNMFSEEEKLAEKVSETEITSIQLEDTLFKTPFGWDEKAEYFALEQMNDVGIISLNRQMNPMSIRRVMSKEEVLELLYSELC